MLKDLRKEAAAGHDKFIAVGVERPDGAAGGALHEAVLPADRETAFGEIFFLFANANYGGVDKYGVFGELFGCALGYDKDAQRLADLGRCNGDSVFFGSECHPHLVDHVFDRFASDVGHCDWCSSTTEYLIGFLDDSCHRVTLT